MEKLRTLIRFTFS